MVEDSETRVRRTVKVDPQHMAVKLYITSALSPLASTGYPVGGGVAILERLLAQWRHDADLDVTVLAPGKTFQSKETNGLRRITLPIPILQHQPLETLLHASSWQYAEFCIQFGRAATHFLLDRKRRHPHELFCVMENDTAEAPDFRELGYAGIPQLAIFHVGVIEFFTQQYCRNLLPPAMLAGVYRMGNRLGLDGVLPKILRLVFAREIHAMRYASHVIVPSNGLANSLRGIHPGTQQKRIQTIPWGIPLASAARRTGLSGAGAPVASCVEGKTGDDDFIILSMSRLSPEKGIERLLRVLRRIDSLYAQTAGRTVAIIAGSGSYMGGKRYEAKLHQLAIGIKHIRILFPGYIGSGAKQALMQKANLFVSSSYYESYGLGIMEALANGVPVLAWRTHGAEETLKDGGGILVDSESEFLDRLLALLRDPSAMEVLQGSVPHRSALPHIGQAAGMLKALMMRWAD